MFEVFEKVFLSIQFWGILITVILTIFIYNLLSSWTRKYIERKKHRASAIQKRKFTLMTLCVSLLKYIFVLIDAIIILGMFGVKVTAFLAGLGIVAVVVGLALQDMLKDLIAGLFIILDDQYNVGDIVEIDGFRGTVSSVGLKSTKVKNYLGDVRVYANRNIGDIINYSKVSSKTTVDFTFPSDIDLKKVEKALDKVIKVCNEKIDDLVEEVHYKGVQEYNDGKITLRLNADVKPLKQYSAKSTILREAKLIFDEMGIKIK